MIQKAFLLAAGLGTRLKPLTNSVPKCLIPICEKPLLGWWIDLLEKHGVTEVLINLHHLSSQVIKFLDAYPTKIRFHLFYEKNLLGSGGTLRENREFVKNDSDFFIIYADNLTNYDLTLFANFHKVKNQILSMALFHTNEPNTCGIAHLNTNDIIISFEEKPKRPESNLANAGIYIAKPSVLDLIPHFEVTDIGFHLLPKLIGNMAGWQSGDYLIDIGNFDNLYKANNEWPKIIKEDNNVIQ